MKMIETMLSYAKSSTSQQFEEALKISTGIKKKTKIIKKKLHACTRSHYIHLKLNRFDDIKMLPQFPAAYFVVHILYTITRMGH